MIRLLKRYSITALKLPFAIVWDIFTLCNFGTWSSTDKVLKNHAIEKQLDEFEKEYEIKRARRKMMQRGDA